MTSSPAGPARGDAASAPVLIGIGVLAEGIGLLVLTLAVFGALGLDRSGYPIVRSFGDPVWLLVSAVLFVAGAALLAVGVARAVRLVLRGR